MGKRITIGIPQLTALELLEELALLRRECQASMPHNARALDTIGQAAKMIAGLVQLNITQQEMVYALNAQNDELMRLVCLEHPDAVLPLQEDKATS